MAMAAGREFEWDEAKAQANLFKHGVPLDYATPVFLDPWRSELEASREKGEARRKVVGLIEGKLYGVVCTDRGGVIRVISARRTNAMEERAYGPV